MTWSPAGEPLGQSIAAPGSIDRVSLGIASATNPDRIHGNWAIALLPSLEEENLYHSFNLRAPLADLANAAARATELLVMKCPSDLANEADNHFQRAGIDAIDAGYARGNYAINGGTNRRCLMRLSKRLSTAPTASRSTATTCATTLQRCGATASPASTARCGSANSLAGWRT